MIVFNLRVSSIEEKLGHLLCLLVISISSRIICIIHVRILRSCCISIGIVSLRISVICSIPLSLTRLCLKSSANITCHLGKKFTWMHQDKESGIPVYLTDYGPKKALHFVNLLWLHSMLPMLAQLQL